QGPREALTPTAEERHMAKRSARSGKPDLDEVVTEIVGRMGVIEKFGEAANHIQGLAQIETDRFGIAVVTADGRVVTGGDAEVPFPIQSISKVFALTIALRAFRDEVWKR